MLPIRSILHPTDFSPLSDDAFRVACLMARDCRAVITVLHVYPTPICHGEVVSRRQDDGYEEELWQKLRRYQAPDSYTATRHQLVEGSAADETLRVADDMKCDLIVLGTHGHTGLKRLLLGSVAEHVIRKAHCPVLAMKGPLPLAKATGVSCLSPARVAATAETSSEH